ncbi:hypothetical protein WL90_26200 [Burkholderia cenocepacia]|nr:hypothetical protein WL90_26200 [Burkholderia cenocepacia]KWF49869.1 hypothetical protein WL89_27690 [Burkholderia cenocepacia]
MYDWSLLGLLAFEQRQDFGCSRRLTKSGEYLFDAVLVCSEVKIGHSIDDQCHMIAMIMRITRGGFHAYASCNACQNYLSNTASTQKVIERRPMESPPLMLCHFVVVRVGFEFRNEFGPVIGKLKVV